MSESASASAAYGVHSEVGRLRKVLVCRPGLAHRRLTPSNNDDLLFDDVMWVDNAEKDHAAFVSALEDRGVEVVELHDVLAQTMAVPGAKDWLLERKINLNQVGYGLVDETRSFLRTLGDARLAELLIGGMATNDLPDDFRSGFAIWSGTSFAAPWIAGDIAAQVVADGRPPATQSEETASRSKEAATEVVERANAKRFPPPVEA